MVSWKDLIFVFWVLEPELYCQLGGRFHFARCCLERVVRCFDFAGRCSVLSESDGGTQTLMRPGLCQESDGGTYNLPQRPEPLPDGERTHCPSPLLSALQVSPSQASALLALLPSHNILDLPLSTSMVHHGKPLPLWDYSQHVKL